MRYLGIDTGWKLRNMSREWAQKNLGGVVGVRLIRELNGEPCIDMKDPLEKKKMIATTRMFGKPVYNLPELKEAVATYTARAAENCAGNFAPPGSSAFSWSLTIPAAPIITTHAAAEPTPPLPMASSLQSRTDRPCDA
ncbi:MAG: hypothetical protein IPI66_07150 [Chitinophagaceae bacterium]|nr:hypothetical protein [Chitinophagaceae bacterium]